MIGFLFLILFAVSEGNQNPHLHSPPQYSTGNNGQQYFQPNQEYSANSQAPTFRGLPTMPFRQPSGFFNKIRSGIAAAGSALVGQSARADYPYGNTPNTFQQQYHQQQSQQPQQVQHSSQVDVPRPSGLGMFSRFRNLLVGSDDSQRNQGVAPSPPQPYSQQQPQQQFSNQYVNDPQSQRFGFGGVGTVSEAQSSAQFTPHAADMQNNGFVTSAPADSFGMPQPLPAASTPAAPVPSLESLIQATPQVFVYDEAVVMILKPREFFRKKLAMTKAGPTSWQLFGDYERVFTNFKVSDGSRALTSTEVVESAIALPPKVLAEIREITEEFSSMELEQEGVLEEYTRRCHEVIAASGALHLSALSALTQSVAHRMSLRNGAAQTLHSLAQKKVPAFLFSSGYGDIVAHSLYQTGCVDKSTGQLPQNIRIISNFCRAGPDGTVRAFSQPIIHERNKNVSTAAKFMGFPVSGSQYALVLGSQEEDVNITEGLEGLQDQLNIGYLDIGEDFLQRLPAFLTSYDAVIIGDGSFQYIRSVINEILQVSNDDGAGRIIRPVLSLFERRVSDLF